MTDKYEALEQELRQATTELDVGDKTLDLGPVVRQANQDLAIRDAINFGFARFLTTVLVLFSGIHRYFNQSDKEQKKDG